MSALRHIHMQWNLQIEDTLGLAIFPTIERLSSSRRSKNVLFL